MIPKATVFIPLKHGVAKLDFEDYLTLRDKNLYSVKTNKHGCYYVCYRGKERPIYIHRIITNNPVKMVVDHKNRNGLDNTKENLRICTRSQNSQNQKIQDLNNPLVKHKKYSKYKGVSLNNGKWRAQITKGNKCFRSFGFNSEIDAALWYNEKAIELFGEFSNINIIQ